MCGIAATASFPWGPTQPYEDDGSAIPSAEPMHAYFQQFEALVGSDDATLAKAQGLYTSSGGGSATSQGEFRHALVQPADAFDSLAGAGGIGGGAEGEGGEYLMAQWHMECLEEVGVGRLSWSESIGFLNSLLRPAATGDNVLALNWKPADW